MASQLPPPPFSPCAWLVRPYLGIPHLNPPTRPQAPASTARPLTLPHLPYPHPTHTLTPLC